MFPPAGPIPYLIAEIGLNHNGDLDLARKMVDGARAAGAHAAKFQLYSADSFIHPSARLGEGSLQDFFRTFELKPAEWKELADYTIRAGLDFFCSVFDAPSIALYSTLPAACIKIASCDLTNRPLIQRAAAAMPDKPFLVATGCSTESEVDDFAAWFAKNISSPLTLLECVSSYPADPRDYNLALLARWENKIWNQNRHFRPHARLRHCSSRLRSRRVRN
jgi:N,N'-diacetyllegionaminate synthase